MGNVLGERTPSLFVFGAERSGTTLVTFLLSGQPGIFVVNDSFAFDQLLDSVLRIDAARPDGRLGLKARKLALSVKGATLANWDPSVIRNPRLLFERTRRHRTNRAPRDRPLSGSEVAAYYDALRARYGGAGRASFLGEYLTSLDPVPEAGTVAGSAGEIVAKIAEQFDDGSAVIGEKTPRHTLVAEWILDLYPNALALLVVRHPLDNVGSLVKRTGSFKEALTRYDLYADVLAAVADHPRVRVLRYEDLAADPPTYIRDLVAWAAPNTVFDPNCEVNAYVKAGYTGTTVDPRRATGANTLEGSQQATIQTRFGRIISQFYSD